jgi:hypothetical protein
MPKGRFKLLAFFISHDFLFQDMWLVSGATSWLMRWMANVPSKDFSCSSIWLTGRVKRRVKNKVSEMRA